jgi:hypothetical protein
MTFTQQLKYAVRSLSRAKGLALTVIATLALGIGVNAAIFSLVRSVLLRPLVNRDEQRLLYIRQSAPGKPLYDIPWHFAGSVPARVSRGSWTGWFSQVGCNCWRNLGSIRAGHAGARLLQDRSAEDRRSASDRNACRPRAKLVPELSGL